MEPRADSYNAPIEELCLTVRCYSALKRDGIDTVGQLAMLPERHLMGLRNFTARTMDELKGRLEELGLFPWGPDLRHVPPVIAVTDRGQGVTRREMACPSTPRRG
jgi:hypothetical protein